MPQKLHRLCIFSAVLALCLQTSASAQLKIGDRVQVNGDYGTVTKLGPPIYSGGNMAYVHLDKFGTTNPNMTIMVDPVNSPGVKLAGPDAPKAPEAGPITGGLNNGNVGAAHNNAGTGAGTGASTGNNNAGQNVGKGQASAGQDIQVPKNAPPGVETFKNVLRARIPQPGWGDTITLEFQSFNLTGPINHTVRYEGHLNQETILGGPGRSQQAWKAHTKFIQRTHFQDIHADDQYFTKSGDYWFYKDPAGYWVSEDENVQLSPTQYIHKG